MHPTQFYVQLNDDYYECLTPKTTVELLELCKAGKPPKMGRWGSLPMNGQVMHVCLCSYSAWCAMVCCKGIWGDEMDTSLLSKCRIL